MVCAKNPNIGLKLGFYPTFLEEVSNPFKFSQWKMTLQCLKVENFIFYSYFETCGAGNYFVSTCCNWSTGIYFN